MKDIIHNIYPSSKDNSYLVWLHLRHPRKASPETIRVIGNLVYEVKNPETEMDEVAVAYIVPRGETIDLQKIVDYCAGKIANFKVPRYVEIVDEFPMIQSGKIQKFHLRDFAKEALAAGKLIKLKPSKR